VARICSRAFYGSRSLAVRFVEKCKINGAVRFSLSVIMLSIAVHVFELHGEHTCKFARSHAQLAKHIRTWQINFLTHIREKIRGSNKSAALGKVPGECRASRQTIARPSAGECNAARK
jgi:hypothetical protein